jgi:streptogramin lyase
MRADLDVSAPKRDGRALRRLDCGMPLRTVAGILYCWSALALAVAVLTIGCGSASADQGAQALPAESIDAFAIPNASAYVTALAPDSEGNIWFTEVGPNVDSGPGTPSKLDRIDPTGIVTGEFSVPFEKPEFPGEGSEPDALAVDTHGNMWFTDGSPDEESVYQVGYVTPVETVNELKVPTVDSDPADIALGSDGAMWFTEEGAGQIGRATELGVKEEFPIPVEAYPVRYGRHVPFDIAMGADGNMWFTDLASDAEGQESIGRITPAGAVTEYHIPIPYGNLSAIARGADGDMWFTESPDGIGRITPEGEISEFAVPGVTGSLGGIAPGSDGNMWFTEGGGKLGRITPAGVVSNFSTAAVGHGSMYAVAQGAEGSIWYVESDGEGQGYHIVRVAIPFAPTNEVPPTISGQAVEGQTLSVSQGSWFHLPSAFEYQWQICEASGVNCTDLGGQTAATHTLAASEVGHTLRAVVSASNIGGSNFVASAVSAVVQAPPLIPSLPAPTLPGASEPLPVVASPMTWNFGWARTYTIVDSLVVRSVPVGGVVEVTCRGRGCAFARWRSDAVARRTKCKRGGCKAEHPTVVHGEVNLAGLFEGRHLKVDTRVVVTISKSGWIGKSFVFTTRAGRPPRVQIACLGSGPSNPAGGC